MADLNKSLLHICYAPADHAWVHGRMVHELGLSQGQYHTRADDNLGELQLQAIAHAVDECRFTVLVASSATRWDKLTQFAAALVSVIALFDGMASTLFDGSGSHARPCLRSAGMGSGVSVRSCSRSGLTT